MQMRLVEDVARRVDEVPAVGEPAGLDAVERAPWRPARSAPSRGRGRRSGSGRPTRIVKAILVRVRAAPVRLRAVGADRVGGDAAGIAAEGGHDVELGSGLLGEHQAGAVGRPAGGGLDRVGARQPDEAAALGVAHPDLGRAASR